MPLDPVTGSIAGAALGGGLSLWESKEEEERAREARPKRRRLARFGDWLRGQEQRRATALASLAQATSDFGSRFR